MNLTNISSVTIINEIKKGIKCNERIIQTNLKGLKRDEKELKEAKENEIRIVGALRELHGEKFNKGWVDKAINICWELKRCRMFKESVIAGIKRGRKLNREYENEIVEARKILLKLSDSK